MRRESSEEHIEFISKGTKYNIVTDKRDVFSDF